MEFVEGMAALYEDWGIFGWMVIILVGMTSKLIKCLTGLKGKKSEGRSDGSK